MNCYLCLSEDLVFFRVKSFAPFDYFHCQRCDLIFQDPAARLSAQEEFERYKHHQYKDTPNYRKFYDPLLTALAQNIDMNYSMTVLDFGSGPDSILAKIFGERGLRVGCYDPFFINDPIQLKKKYDLIVSTEVFEHFYDPHLEINKLMGLLVEGGHLGIMTSFHRGIGHFADWYYRRDTTHVSFYSEKTFLWIAEFYDLSIVAMKDPVCVIKK